ncbi:hypothetical protein D3C80_561290 [compost metagenome]
MRQNVDIWPLPDGQRLQRFQRQIVPALDGAVVGFDDDALVDAGSLEVLVHDLRRTFDVGDAARRAALGKRGDLDLDVFGMRDTRGQSGDRHGGEKGERFGHGRVGPVDDFYLIKLLK